MPLRREHLWPVFKLLLALVLLAGVGWHFARILRQPDLWQQPLPWRREWLLLAGLVYILGQGCSALFWYWLLRAVDAQPLLVATVRGYYIGQLGKYVPGKAWGLLLRTGLLVPSGIRPAVGAMTATFETLTTMAAGALTATVLFALVAFDKQAAWWSLGLLGLAGLPILPVFFNPLMKLLAGVAGRAARRFGSATEVAPLPQVHYRTLAGGVLLTACGWACLGLSLWAVLQGLLPEPVPWTWDRWGRCTAYVALAGVGGFLSFVTPGGLGAREAILLPLVTSEIRQAVPDLDAALATGLAGLVVIVLRLLWTATEVVTVTITWWLPDRALPR